MRVPFQAKKDGRIRRLSLRGVLTAAALASCLLSGCASGRNRAAGDPLLGDFFPQRMKTRSSPSANSNSSAANASKPTPIPKLEMTSSNAEYAQGDPLRGDLAINRQTAERLQDPWQGRNGVNTQDPVVRQLPREEQQPGPQVVPSNPNRRPTSVGWQGPANTDINPKTYDEYLKGVQQSAVNEANRWQNNAQQLQQAGMQKIDAAQQAANQQYLNLQTGAQNLRDDFTATATQVRDTTVSPFAQRFDQFRNVAADEWNRFKYGTQQLQENIAASAVKLRDNTLNAFNPPRPESIRNAAATSLDVGNTAPTMQDYVAAQSVPLVDQLQAQLKARGVRWQQQVNVPEGVRFTCIVPRRDDPSVNRTYEATASDSVSALRAVLQQIDQGQ